MKSTMLPRMLHVICLILTLKRQKAKNFYISGISDYFDLQGARCYMRDLETHITKSMGMIPCGLHNPHTGFTLLCMFVIISDWE
jgi:hypothetical protein